MKERRVIISGGGTGGHLYPALAVGQKLREADPRLELTFVGSRRSLEKTLMERSGARFVAVRIEGLKGRGLKSLKALALLPFAFIKSLLILLRLNPDLVIGVGGYSSGPVVLLASLLGKPTLILEQNLYPGFTNRLLTRWTRRVVVAFENSLAFFKGKGIFLGNPVREEFYRLGPKPRTRELTLLVFGGSQGAHVLNEAMAAALPLLRAERENLRIYHQTGAADFERVKSVYVREGFEGAVVSPYFFEMARCFECSDLVICRAGATTIAELIATQKASVLVPFARAADDHQAKNARELERVGGARVILEKELSPRLLAETILSFLKDKEQINALERNLAALKTDRPAEKIAGLCFSLMGADA
jgi:UDP-N-acetylglucosamine--N-acetylmuramyl-(pentapeptide) pyrophosphoryl-undecaprenol N-acetylglucosamine transferase